MTKGAVSSYLHVLVIRQMFMAITTLLRITQFRRASNSSSALKQVAVQSVVRHGQALRPQQAPDDPVIWERQKR